MQYFSTRNPSEFIEFEDVILNGLAPDGGLYLPRAFPQLDLVGLPMDYKDLAGHILGLLIDDSAIKDICARAFDRFTHPEIAPLMPLNDNTYVLELFHGPTLAFKDYPLQVLGQVFDHILEENGQHLTILGATSGDTGSAAIEGCKNCAHLDIFILHPHQRTSEVQRRQMTSIRANHVHNIALKGTFDDCQSLVKNIFADQDFRQTHALSAINSINWVRIAAQIVYYVYAWQKAGKPDAIQFAVPTGNFGNVFAAHCARKMGLPIKKLIIATNENDVLARFFDTGRIERTQVHHTLSPSMDIQIPSNFERYLYTLYGADLPAVMQQLKSGTSVDMGANLLARARNDFVAARIDDAQTLQTIHDVHAQYGMILDPHTAVGYAAAMQKRDADMPLVTLACAHPAKFPDAIEKAIGVRPALPDHLADLYQLTEHYDVMDNNENSLKEFIGSKITND